MGSNPGMVLFLFFDIFFHNFFILNNFLIFFNLIFNFFNIKK
jgi:hypothetical protein